MQSKEAYLDSVCSEIKFRAARKYLRKELSAHIDDKAEELKKEGSPSPEEAAVAVMGDAVETGRALNKAHRPRTEWGIIACFLLLSIAGLFSLYAGTTWGPYDNVDQLFWINIDPKPVFIGICAAAAMYFINYTLIVRFRHFLFGVALLYVAGFTVYNEVIPFSSNSGFFGQTAVIVISSMFFILSITGYIQSSNTKAKRILVTIFCALSVFAMSLLSTCYSLLLAFVYIVLLGLNTYQRRENKWVWPAIASVAVVFAIMLSFIFPISFNTFGTDIGSPYYTNQIYMLHGAKLIGASPEYIQNTTWGLEGSTTGYILTAVIGAFGWLAGICIILIFAALLIVMVIRIIRMPHCFGQQLATGINAYFFIRFALFTLANLGVIDGISVNLPFVSFGSFNYLTDAILVGVFLSVWRRSSFMKEDEFLSSDRNLIKT